MRKFEVRRVVKKENKKKKKKKKKKLCHVTFQNLYVP